MSLETIAEAIARLPVLASPLRQQQQQQQQLAACRPKLEKWVGENFRSLVGSGSPFLKNAYGMVVDLKTAEFLPWTTLIEQFVFDKDEPYFNIMVPTADTTRCVCVCFCVYGRMFLFVANLNIRGSWSMQAVSQHRGSESLDRPPCCSHSKSTASRDNNRLSSPRRARDFS